MESEGAGDQVIESEAGWRTAADGVGGGWGSMSAGVRWGRAAGTRRLKCRKRKRRRERERKAAGGVISGPRTNEKWLSYHLHHSPPIQTPCDRSCHKESRNSSRCQERKLPRIDTDNVLWIWNIWNENRMACTLPQSHILLSWINCRRPRIVPCGLKGMLFGSFVYFLSQLSVGLNGKSFKTLIMLCAKEYLLLFL